MNLRKKYFSNIHGKIALFVLWVLLLTGCGGNVSVLKKEAMEEPSGKEQTGVKDTKEEISQEQNTENSNPEVLIYVDLGGAVNNPGVYTLAQGSRVFQLMEQAGGFCKDAYTKNINLAGILEDGEQIYVYTTEEAEQLLSQGGLPDWGNLTDASTDKSSGKVNLNQAEKEDLMTLTGIGAARAEAILAYRDEHGRFKNIEELMQVEGIKQKTYEKIKDCITVQ